MYDDLIKRLRECVRGECWNCSQHKDSYDGQRTCADNLMKQAADAIAELSVVVRAQKAVLDKFPKWIPVTERLPESDTNVLVKSGSFVSVWSLREGDVYWEDEYSYFHDMCEVTHWMPLPPAPKEE